MFVGKIMSCSKKKTKTPLNKKQMKDFGFRKCSKESLSKKIFQTCILHRNSLATRQSDSQNFITSHSRWTSFFHEIEFAAIVSISNLEHLFKFPSTTFLFHSVFEWSRSILSAACEIWRLSDIWMRKTNHGKFKQSFFSQTSWSSFFDH